MSEKIKIGDVYGVYKVLRITMPTTKINDATIKLKCSKCGEEIEKNYNHMLKQFRHGKMNDCICYSGTNKNIPMTKEYDKLTTALSKIKAYYRNNKDFVCDKTKKIFKYMDTNDLDFSDDRFEYSICTKDGSLKFIAGNVTFKPILKSNIIDEVENNITISHKLSKSSSRKKVIDLIKSNLDKTNKEIIDGNSYISYNRDRLIQKVRIGSVYGNCIVDGLEYSKDNNLNTKVVLRCNKCGNIFTRDIRRFLGGCYFCTFCEKQGYRSYRHKKNSTITEDIENKIKRIKEVASIECMSDYTKYSASFDCLNFNEIIDLKLDSFSSNSFYNYSQFVNVFGYDY